MTGHHVERRFGWDCHGLPIEFEIDKIHKIANSVERETIGVKKYNEWCREIVMRYSSEWEKIIGRFGRWIDFKNDYKTMDCKYMESVWWAFSEMYKKDLVYRGSKIMPFSTACNTVLSNFEAGSNYKDVSDPPLSSPSLCFLTLIAVLSPGPPRHGLCPAIWPSQSTQPSPMFASWMIRPKSTIFASKIVLPTS